VGCGDEILEHAIAATGPIMKQSHLHRFGFTGGDNREEARENDSTTQPKCVAPRFSRSRMPRAISLRKTSRASSSTSPCPRPSRSSSTMPSSFACDARVTIPALVAAARRAPLSQRSLSREDKI
jgi:hypothetical protein